MSTYIVLGVLGILMCWAMYKAIRAFIRESKGR